MGEGGREYVKMLEAFEIFSSNSEVVTEFQSYMLSSSC